MKSHKNLFKRSRRTPEPDRDAEPRDEEKASGQQDVAAPRSAPEQVDLNKLHSLLDDCFNASELRVLCFVLGVDYDNLPGQGKAAKIRELITYFTHPKRNIAQLVQACAQQSPNSPWDILDTTGSESHSTSALAGLRQALAEHLDVSQVRDLCTSLGMEYESLPGAEERDKTRELVSYLARRGRIAELVEACARQRPDVPWQKALEHEPVDAPPGHKALDPADLNKLYRLLDYCFSANEFRDLCFDLGVEYDLPGIGKMAKTRELIVYFTHPKRNIAQLVQVCAQQRPNFPWDTLDTTGYELHSMGALSGLRQALAEHFDASQVRDLCASLKVDHERLPGSEEADRARELVLYLARRGRIAELVTACAQQRPDVRWEDTLHAARDEPPAAEAVAQKTLQRLDRGKLLHMLATHFDEAQLRDIGFELGVDYDRLPGEVKAAKARELVLHFQRRGRLPELAGEVARLRPDALRAAGDSPGPKAPPRARRVRRRSDVVTPKPPAATPAPGAVNPPQLMRLIDRHFNANELRSLCFDLKIDYDNLKGETKVTKARSLIQYFMRRDNVAQLVQVCGSLRPEVAWEQALAATEKESRPRRKRQIRSN